MELPPRRRARLPFADFVRCEWPLPAPAGVQANALEFQTRSLAGRRDRFTITAQGALLRRRSRPAAPGVLRTRGLNVLLAAGIDQDDAMGAVSDFTGEIRFGAGLGRTLRNGLPSGWIEYHATFHAGRLEKIRLLQYKTPDSDS